jgi:O-antigen/teichoic acid export membrane protein
MINRIRKYFTEGNERSTRAKKNILLSFFIRGGSIGISLVLVPLTLHAISSVEYGVWLTISSFIGWFSFFDIGLGNGLRNKFTEAMAKNDRETARQYVSTTYALLTVIVLVMTALFFTANSFIRWTSVFNADETLASQLNILLPAVFLLFALQFVIQLISTILTADQRPAVSNFLGLLGSIITLGGIYLVKLYSVPTLLNVGLIFTAAPVLVLIAAHLYFYSTRYSALTPSLKHVRLTFAKDLGNLGGQFFIIQIAVLILFSTSNMIIAQYLGPQEVTAYNIALKYFGVLNSVFVLIANPFWSAITDAYHRNDTEWIRRSIRKLIGVWVLLTISAVVMLATADTVYRLWIGDAVTVPFTVSLAMTVFVILSNWNSIFAAFLNGTGKIRLQLYSAAVVSVINIPLSIYLTQLYGLPGVIIGTVCCIAVGSVWAPIQYHKLINNTAAGIWAK